MESPAVTSSGNIIAPDHRGPAVDISIWIFFVLSGLAVVSKVLTKLARASTKVSLRKLQVDDFVLSLTLILALGYTLSVSRQVKAGLGTPIDRLKPESIEKYEKAGYASEMLYVCTLCAVNSAAIIFGLMLEPSKSRRVLFRGTLGFNFLWLTASIFGIAFQCPLPQTWATLDNQCFNQPAFWSFVEISNLFTNAAITAILIGIIWGLQMRHRMTRYVLAVVFALRILLILPVSFKLKFMFERHSTRNSDNWNPTSDAVDEVIFTSAMLNASIAIACLPFFKTLMESLQPGWSTGQVRPGVGYDIMVTKTIQSSSQELSGMSR